MPLLKHASTQSKAHKTKTGSGKGQASYIRPNIYAEKSNVCNLLLKQDIRLVINIYHIKTLDLLKYHEKQVF